jgi:hypothetical protein
MLQDKCLDNYTTTSRHASTCTQKTGEQQREQEHVVRREWLALLPRNILVSPRKTRRVKEKRVKQEHRTWQTEAPMDSSTGKQGVRM